jgi:hypothetical protein
MTVPTSPGSFGQRRLASRRLRLALRKLLPFVNWNRAYGTMSYLRSALWVMPLVAVVAALVFARLIVALDQWIPWDLTTLAPNGARAVPDGHHADPLVHGLRLRLPARRDPDRRRPAHAAHHRHDPAARPGHPPLGRAQRLHDDDRGRRAESH